MRPGPSQAAIRICSPRSTLCYAASARKGEVATTRSISRPALEESSRPSFSFRRCRCDTTCAKLRCGWRSPNLPTLFHPRIPPCSAAVMNFCGTLKLSCGAGATQAHHLCHPTQSSSASSLFVWDSKVAKIGNKPTKALAQIFTRSAASISAADGSMQPQQLRNAAQDEEANENSCCHDDKKRCEHDNDEEPIRCTGALWRGGVGEKKLII